MPTINNVVKAVASDKFNNIYWGGEFDFSNGVSLISIMKTNSSMIIDPSFAANVTATGIFPTNTYVRALVVDGSDKVYAGGNFFGFIAKLNPDGTENTLFKSNMGSGFDQVVYAMKIISDNEILVGGEFTTYKGISCPKLAKISFDGLLDTAFCANMQNLALDGLVLSIEQTSDGNFLVGGTFTKKIIALKANGSINTSYNFGSGFNSAVFVIKEFIDGKILIGGDFTEYNGETQNGFIKINRTGNIDSTFQGNGKLPPGQGVYTIHF